MRNLLIFFISFLYLPTFSQSSISKLFLIPDSISSIQAHVIRVVNSKIFVLANTNQFQSPNGPNFIPYIQQYNYGGSQLSSEQVDSSFPQIIQMFSQEGFCRVGNILVFSGDITYGTGDSLQNTKIYAFDLDGKPKWHINLHAFDSLSTSGCFVPISDNFCVHGMIKSPQDSLGDRLHLLAFDSLGNTFWQRSIALPDGNSGVYFSVNSAVKSGNKIIWTADYQSIGGDGYGVVIETRLDGDLLADYKIFNKYELMLSPLNSTSYYSAASIVFGQMSSYCIERHFANYDSIEWNECFNSDDNLVLWALKADSAGNLYQVGEAQNMAGSERMAFISKSSTNGNFIMHRRFRFPMSSGFRTEIRSMDFLNDGRIATIGVHRIQDKAYQWLMILDENGCFNGDCSDVIELDEDIVTQSEPVKKDLLSIYPNPVLSHFNIDCPQNGTLRCSNQLGQQLFVESVTIGLNTIEVHSLAQGTYFLHFTDENGLNQKSGIFIKY